MREYLFILIIAAVVTYLLTPLVRQGAIAIHAQHAPRARDVHKEPTPLLGGVAMYGGLVAALLVADRLSYLAQAFPPTPHGHPGLIEGLLLAAGLLVVVGIVDDRWGLGAISKLAAQIAAGGIVVWSGAYVPWIPGPGSGTVVLEPDLSYVLTILIIVATVNAVNFIDGLDGLAAGVVGISAVAYLVYSYELTNSVGIQSQSVPAVVSAVLAGICFGFLPHNFNPARIFMGDTGSMLLGLLLAYGPISSAASLDYNLLITHSQGAAPGQPVPDDPAAAHPDRDLADPVHGHAARGGPPDDEGHVAVRRRPAAPAPPAAEHGPLAPPDRAAHVPVGGIVRRPRGRPVGAADQPGLVRRHHARRHRGPAARDGAEAPPVALHRRR